MPPPTGCGSGPYVDPTPSGSHIWHVAATLSQQEHRAYNELCYQGFVAYLPLYLEPDTRRIVPLFRGYLFVAFDPEVDQWRAILSTRGIWSLIWRSPERPASVPVGYVEDLMARTSERRVVDDPGVNAALPSIMPVGAPAEVVEGPLAGWRGLVAASNANRCSLLLSLLGGMREVEFKQSAVKPVST